MQEVPSYSWHPIAAPFSKTFVGIANFSPIVCEYDVLEFILFDIKIHLSHNRQIVIFRYTESIQICSVETLTV